MVTFGFRKIGSLGYQVTFVILVVIFCLCGYGRNRILGGQIQIPR